MSYDCLFQRHELFVASATLAAHANAVDGFRQRDVRFLIDLFADWVAQGVQRSPVSFQNTQVLRYLNSLVDEGFARKQRKGAHPLYRLTRVGLLEILSRMVEQPQLARGAHFFFLFYFIKSYGPRIDAMVQEEGRQFPYTLRVELDRLLDPRELLNRELKYANQELDKLRHRIDFSDRQRELVGALLKAGQPFEKVLKEAERKFPYNLNSQKPLSELIGGLRSDLQSWELDQGNKNRIVHMWLPEKVLLEGYIRSLESLREG